MVFYALLGVAVIIILVLLILTLLAAIRALKTYVRSQELKIDLLLSENEDDIS